MGGNLVVPAEVVAVKTDAILVRAAPQTGCQACADGRGCQGGLLGRLIASRRGDMHLPRPPFSCTTGDTVLLSLSAHKLTTIAWLTYGSPILALLLVAMLFSNGVGPFDLAALVVLAMLVFVAPRRAARYLGDKGLSVTPYNAPELPRGCAARA